MAGMDGNLRRPLERRRCGRHEARNSIMSRGMPPIALRGLFIRLWSSARPPPGNLVGTVGRFTSTTQPLGLVAGRHQLEIRAPGYRTMSFDVDIIAGQVIPYEGTFER